MHLLAKKRSRHAVNTMAYTIGVGGNVAAMPQIIRAWQGPAPGISGLSWILYVVIGCIWLVYAIQHRQKPLIIAQAVCITADLAVVVGWLVFTVHR